MAEHKLFYDCLPPDEIVKRMAKEDDVKIRKRWHVIYLICRINPQRKKPLTNKEIAVQVGFEVQHIRNVRLAFQEGGPDAVEMIGSRDRKGKAGRKRKLDQGELESLGAYLKTKIKPRWEDVHDYSRDVLKMKEPLRESTARRRLKEFHAGEFEPPQELDGPTELEKQASSTRADKRLSSSGKASKQSPQAEKEPSQPIPGFFDLSTDDET